MPTLRTGLFIVAATTLFFLATSFSPFSPSLAEASGRRPLWEQRTLQDLNPKMQELYYNDVIEREQLKSKMVTSIQNYITVCKRRSDSRAMVIQSCRNAPIGCSARLGYFVDYILNAAEAYNLNPWLLAAMAYNESRFNPFAEGPAVSSRGILQINPRGKRGKASPFVRNGELGKRFRKQCRDIPGNCQEEIVFKAASHLSSSMRKCGTLAGGLSMYNTGRCGVRRLYVKNTAKAWRALQMNDGDKSKIPWCGGHNNTKRN